MTILLFFFVLHKLNDNVDVIMTSFVSVAVVDGDGDYTVFHRNDYIYFDVWRFWSTVHYKMVNGNNGDAGIAVVDYGYGGITDFALHNHGSDGDASSNRSCVLAACGDGDTRPC